MNGDAWRVRQRVIDAWNDAIYGLRQMSQASNVLPASPFEIFILAKDAPDDTVKLTVGPVVFNVKERPNRRAPDLFIVVKGWLSFEGADFSTLPMKTKDFGTKVAYFRSKPGTLEHIYGAHYDMDEVKFGHPVFHTQLGPQVEFGTTIGNLFGDDGQVVDYMGKILRTVRTPSAQMDVFSVLTQICADHLMGEQPASEVRDAFQRMRNACDFLVGAAHRMTFLNSGSAVGCYRSTHWYAGE